MKVYVFGDSHAGKFGIDPDHFILGNAGQATAHNLCNHDSNSQSWFALQQCLYFFNADEDVFMFALGEIDCRIHFYELRMKTGRTYHDLMTDTVQRYGHIIKAVRDDGRRVAVLDVPPAVKQGNIYNLEHYGHREERAFIILIFNACLGQWCDQNEIPFIELHPYIADKNGFLKKKYAEPDDAHVSASAVPFVLEELANHYPELL